MPVLVEDRHERHREFDWIVGVNIRHLRILKDIEQRALAKAVDMDVSQLSRVENGLRSIKFKEAMAIAGVLGVKPERLTRKIIQNTNSKEQH